MSSSVISASIETFQHQGDLYTKKIEIEKRRISELDSKLKNAKNRLIDARRSMGGVNEAQNQMRKKQRQMRVLENQLEKAIVRLNEGSAFNERKRREIEDLRREKLQRDGELVFLFPRKKMIVLTLPSNYFYTSDCSYI